MPVTDSDMLDWILRQQEFVYESDVPPVVISADGNGVVVTMTDRDGEKLTTGTQPSLSAALEAASGVVIRHAMHPRVVLDTRSNEAALREQAEICKFGEIIR